MITLDLQFSTKGRLFEGIKLPDPIRLGLRGWVAVIARRARQNLSGRFLRVASGKLSRSVRTRVSVRGDVLVGVVQSKLFYGRILEGGAAPHFVRPRPRTVLRFQVAGRTVFAAHVKHPGVRPRPWFRTAWTEGEQEGRAAFEAEITKALTGVDRVDNG